MTVVSSILQAVSTFLFALSAYFFAKWISDRAGEELLRTLGEAEVERPTQDSLAREYQRRGYLNEVGELDYGRIMPDEQDELDNLEDMAREFATSYADWRMRAMYLKVAEKRKKQGNQGKRTGIALIISAGIVLLISTLV